MSRSSKAFPFQVGILTLIRMVVQTATRMIYPFLAVFARGLDVQISSITIALGISMLTSLLGPLLSPLSDRYGRKTGILLGLVIFTFSSGLVVIFPIFPIFALSLFAGNLAINLFLPAVFAYLSDRTSYARRGMVIGIFEISWALCYIVLVPLIGLLIEREGWQSAYGVLTLLGVLSILLVFWSMPVEKPKEPAPDGRSPALGSIMTSKPAMMMLLFGLFLAGGNELVSVMFGVWIEDSFDLQIAALGAASAIIGFSELGGEGLSAFLTDKIGKEKAVIIGLTINSLAMIALPLFAQSFFSALVWLFLVYLSFEWVMVSSLALTSEVLPGVRATLLSAYIASHAISRMLADFSAPLIYQNGFFINALACLVMNLLAIQFLRKVRLSSA